MTNNPRLEKFFAFLVRNGFDGSVTYFKKEYHINVNINGEIIAYGQHQNLNMALNEVLQAISRVGLS